MVTMNVSLPDPMEDWVEAQARNGRYGNASDSVRDLNRRDQGHLGAIGELQGLIDQGLASGASDRSGDDLRRLSRERAARRE